MAQIFDTDPDFGREVPGIPDQNLLETQMPMEDMGMDLNMAELVENEDGSVEIPILDELEDVETGEFLDNLAEKLEEGELVSIADEYMELIKKDKDAREKRDKQYEEGLRRTGLGDDAPGGAQFEGASRVVHPILAEACVDFSARAIKELLPPNGPVKTHLEGKVTQEVIERAEIKARGMNWQITKGIPEYRDETEQLLTQTPMGGSQYKKYWVENGIIHVEFIPIDNIYLPFSSSNFYRSPRVTHAQDITKFVFKERVKSGLYRDIENIEFNTPQFPDETASQKANNKIEGKDDNNAYNDDGLRRVLEIYTWLDIDDPLVPEGEKAPYILTIDEYTEEILAIYRNWEEADEKRTKLDWIVEYKFIPWRGAYGIGLPHLIGGISAALTGALRALMDSAHINNAATMLKLKGGRVTGQNTSVEVTQVSEIEAPAGIDDVRKIAMPMPFNPPSPVLFQLLGFLENAGKSVVSTSMEALSKVGDRTPVGTTMALIEQGASTYAAIHARLHASQRKELEIISRLNRTFPEILDGVNAAIGGDLAPEDFRYDSDIQPVSDPNIFSEAQRYAQFQAVLQMAQDPTVAWDKTALYRIGMKLMKFPYSDEVLPIQPKPEHVNPVEENVLATKGMPLAAHTDQDHKAHMITHLLFCTSPIYGANPLMGNPTVPVLVQHCKEHLTMFYQQHTKAAIQAIHELGPMTGDEYEDQVYKAVALADQRIAQELAQIMPMLEEAMKIAQGLTQQQPQMDPQSQVALQIGQAEIERKKALDAATIELKNQELQIKSTLEQQQQAFNQAKVQFEQQMAQAEEARKAEQQVFENNMAEIKQFMEEQRQQMLQEIELVKNDNDNQQKQMTELLKNRDDNETKKFIEMMKSEMQGMMSQMQMPAQQDNAVDLVNQVKQMMDQVRQDDRMATIMQGLQAVVEGVHSPKQHQVVRGPDGKVLGIQTTQVKE